MSLVFTLASRNLFQDRLRFIASLIGIVFSVVLVMVQLGLYFGFDRMLTMIIDHASTDLWVVSSETRYFEDLSLLDSKMRERLLAIDGVAEAVPVVAGFSVWMLPEGGMTSVFVVASDLASADCQPGMSWKGRPELAEQGTVAIDRSYAAQLGVSGVGATAQIRGQPVIVGAVTDGIRSFTTTPYVFSDLAGARSYLGLPANFTTHFLVRLKPGADLEHARQNIVSGRSGIQALTPDQFSDQSRSFWLFRTGAGAALVAGALLAVIVGTVIVAQTLYSSTKEHLYEFATLRAMGASNSYIYKVIICQALIDTIIGTCDCGVDRRRRRSFDRQQRDSDRDNAPIDDRVVRAHRRHVHRFGDCVDCARRSCRSCDRVDPMTTAIIEAANVSKSYGSGPARVQALKDVNLVIRSGELTVLMGPSGSGKTTLLSILGCMLAPTGGIARVCGVSTVGARPEQLATIRRRHIGFVFQSYHLFSTLTAAENVQLALDVRGERGPKAVAKAEEMLASVGLSSKLESFPRQLSGGEQQRVAIARAIVAGPSAILADEPTAALDSANGQAIMAILSAIAKERDRAVLVVTHDPRLFGFADRIVHIEDGSLTREDLPN